MSQAKESYCITLPVMNQKPNQDGKMFKVGTGASTRSNNMDSNVSKPQPACINPLAKAKEKRPKADKTLKSR